MYKLLNINSNKLPLISEVTPLSGESIHFNIGSIINKRSKDELDELSQYDTLNKYCNYKGLEFKNTLYSKYIAAARVITGIVFKEATLQDLIDILHSVIDMFDTADVEYFLTDVLKIAIPDNLQEVFNDRIESDGLGTRVQTYLKSDYIQLATLTVIMKAVLPIAGDYAKSKESEISNGHKEYILYSLISGHPINDYPAAIKLKAWIDILIALCLPDKDTLSIIIIEKQIPESEINSFIYSMVMVQKVAIASIVNDDRNRNVITRIYNYIINKLKVKGSPSSKIRDKKPLADTDSNTGDKESMIESYRIVTDLTPGAEVELNWVCSDLSLLSVGIKLPYDKVVLSDAVKFNQSFREWEISNEQIVLLGYIFKRIIDPRSIYYLNIDGIINLLSLGFAILRNLGYPELAVLLTSKSIIESGEVTAINTAATSIRFDPAVKEKLNALYPYEKQINATKTVNLAETAISQLVNSMFKRVWRHTCDSKYITELGGDPNSYQVLPNDIKTMIALAIIDLEEKM